MKKKLSESFAAQLSLRFMFIITTSVIFISVFFLFFTWSLARNTQTQELMLILKINYLAEPGLSCGMWDLIP